MDDGGGLRVRFGDWRMALSLAAGLASHACGGTVDDSGAGGRTATPRTPAGGQSTGDDGGPGGAPAVEHCIDPAPLVVAGEATGYIACAGGVVHRAEIRDCPVTPPTGEACEGTEMECRTDADCGHLPVGRCVAVPGFDGKDCLCAGCVRDSDCASDEVCVCGDPTGMCVPATCRSDADCGGLPCMTYRSVCGSVAGVACRTANDACTPGRTCDSCKPESWDGKAQWTCPDAICGRPFLVNGHARTAYPTPREGWATTFRDDFAAASLELKAEAARHYTRTALAEHASIAAFGRFVLQLLHLGAPAELVSRASSAISDEVAHARVCFAVASALSQAPVGPGPLDVAGALGAESLSEILEGAIVEGCVGESLAAIEAAEGAAHAESPELRLVLERIARDELEHAALSWRFVRWAIDAGLVHPDEALSMIDRACDAALGARSVPQSRADELLTFGIVAGTPLVHLRRRAVDEILRPQVEALRERTTRATDASKAERVAGRPVRWRPGRASAVPRDDPTSSPSRRV